jgi:protein N-terminal amidase
MRIACLQFSPTLGAVQSNITRANTLLSTSSPRLQNIDLLVLPELAFAGYNFPSLTAISPHLEPTSAGPSTTWALATARRLNCVVSVGYPEIANGPTRRYNSTVTVSPTGTILAHYRKSFLYYTDSTWASEGPSGFWSGSLPLPSSPVKSTNTTTNHSDADCESITPSPQPEPSIPTAMGICMDLNPHAFTAPWTAYEFATHVLSTRSSLVILSMAWLTRLAASDLVAKASEPDLETFAYWLERLGPVVEKGEGREGETVIVLANRSGSEPGAMGTEEARYAGSSTVLGIADGRVRVFGILGRAEEGVLVVDTSEEAPMEVRSG